MCCASFYSQSAFFHCFDGYFRNTDYLHSLPFLLQKFVSLCQCSNVMFASTGIIKSTEVLAAAPRNLHECYTRCVDTALELFNLGTFLSLHGRVTPAVPTALVEGSVPKSRSGRVIKAMQSITNYTAGNAIPVIRP